MNRLRRTVPFLVCALITSASLFGQGPASCGFHLDIHANGTSTHSAVADLVAGGPGAFVGMPSGAPGSPYTAYATPGTMIDMVINANSLAYGPLPIGAGSCASIFYAVGAPIIGLGGIGPPFLPTCGGGPHIIGILGLGPLTTVIDTCGFLGPPFPGPVGLWDVAFNPTPGRLVFSAALPPFMPPVMTFQVAMITPLGTIGITNAVSLVTAGPNPAEVPVPFPIACGGPPPLDDGQAVGLPTPGGFTFYGFPAPAGFMDMDTNGFVDFLPGAAVGGCDVAGTSGDLGCPAILATARPRIDVNHANYDFGGGPPAAPWVPGMTMEFRPAVPGLWQDAWIFRWKNAPALGAIVGVPGYLTSSMSLELQGGACGCAPANRIVVTREWLPVSIIDQCGISPGLAAHGFGGPPPAALPSTCGAGAAGIAFMGTFAPPFGLPYFGGISGVIHTDPTTPFAAISALANSAAVFTPALLGAPDGYFLQVL